MLLRWGAGRLWQLRLVVARCSACCLLAVAEMLKPACVHCPYPCSMTRPSCSWRPPRLSRSTPLPRTGGVLPLCRRMTGARGRARRTAAGGAWTQTGMRDVLARTLAGWRTFGATANAWRRRTRRCAKRRWKRMTAASSRSWCRCIAAACSDFPSCGACNICALDPDLFSFR